jgi:hypothetical protein
VVSVGKCDEWGGVGETTGSGGRGGGEWRWVFWVRGVRGNPWRLGGLWSAQSSEREEVNGTGVVVPGGSVW